MSEEGVRPAVRVQLFRDALEEPVRELPVATWVAWAERGTVRVAANPDLEELMRQLGRPFASWGVWENAGGKPGLAFISAWGERQLTIRKEEIT